MNTCAGGDTKCRKNIFNEIQRLKMEPSCISGGTKPVKTLLITRFATYLLCD